MNSISPPPAPPRPRLSTRLAVAVAIGLAASTAVAVPASAWSCPEDPEACTVVKVVLPPKVSTAVDGLVRSLSLDLWVGEMPSAQVASFALAAQSGSVDSGGANCENMWGAQYFHRAKWYTNGSGVKYDVARSRRTKGCAQYEAHVHAALVIDVGDGFLEDRWGPFQAGCATVTVANSTAQTCSSPWLDAEPGEAWTWAAGFRYDFRQNGTNDFPCDGCIDMTVVMPTG